MADVFASADVLVAILEPDAGVFCVPSKVLSYLCAERPVLAAIPRENLAARIVASTRSGLVAEPADAAGFLRAAERLCDSPKLRARCGRRARRYAEERFDFDRICSQFERILAGAPPARYQRLAATPLNSTSVP
jgi:glycosyltransferase involved in cell wall biosynthesis